MNAQRRALLKEKQDKLELLLEELTKNLRTIRNEFPGSYDRVEELVARMDPHASPKGKDKQIPAVKVATQQNGSPQPPALQVKFKHVIDANVDIVGSGAASKGKKHSAPDSDSSDSGPSKKRKGIPLRLPPPPQRSSHQLKKQTGVRELVVQCSDKKDPDGFKRCICSFAKRECVHPLFKRIYVVEEATVTNKGYLNSVSGTGEEDHDEEFLIVEKSEPLG